MSQNPCGLHCNPEKHGKVISLSSVRQEEEILYSPYNDYDKARAFLMETCWRVFYIIFSSFCMVYGSL